MIVQWRLLQVIQYSKNRELTAITPPNENKCSVTDLIVADVCVSPVAVETPVDTRLPRPPALLEVVVGFVSLIVLEGVVVGSGAPEIYQSKFPSQIRPI